MSKNGKIVVAGIGPGGEEDMTPAVRKALTGADVIIGYHYYFRFIRHILPEHTECVDTGMKQEKERAAEAFRYAHEGKNVCVISSGDSGIYGMAPLVYEMAGQEATEIEIEVLPGISAFQKASAILGAPCGHDLCILSLSDLMTPWEKIERRIIAAASGDFVTAIYNPISHGRYWQLPRLKELFLQYRDPDTPVGFVTQAGREEQTSVISTLAEMDPSQADMFTVILIGNSQSYLREGKMITPRGYYREEEESKDKPGRQIMIRSFRTIEKELSDPDIPLGKKWALLHAIHTTADFEMEKLLVAENNAVEKIHEAITGGKIKTIITDVTMVTSGIRKTAAERYGVEILCYLHDPRTGKIAEEMGITRTQAGIRLAVKEHPGALYVFGNAPTALMELCRQIKAGHASPGGVIAAPVGFVNVRESKHMVKPFTSVPQIIIEGRKGGSNLAATLVNAILSLEDAAELRPGRDV